MKVRYVVFLVLGLVFVCRSAWSDSLVLQIRHLDVKLENGHLAAARQEKDAVPKDALVVPAFSEIPEDAKLLWSLEVSVDAGSPFYHKATVRDMTIEVRGAVKKNGDGRFTLDYRCSIAEKVDEDPELGPIISKRAVSGRLELTVGQEAVVCDRAQEQRTIARAFLLKRGIEPGTE